MKKKKKKGDRGFDSHLILHPGSPWYRDLHVDVLKELRAHLWVWISSALHCRLHPASGGRRRGVGGVSGPRGDAVQSVDAARAGVVSLLLVIAGQDDCRTEGGGTEVRGQS